MLTKLAKVVATVALAVSAGSATYAQSIKGSISLASQPEELAVNYLTNRIYVALPSFGSTADSIAVIDGKSDTVVDTISIPPVGQRVAVDVVTNAIYAAGCYTDDNGDQQCEVAVVNGWNKKVRRTITVTTTSGAGIEGIAVDPLTGTVFISNASDNVIDVIHRGSDKVNDEISVEQSPFGITANPFNNRVYVALSNGTVDVIDVAKQTITATTTVGGTNAGIAVNWLTGNVFVTDNTLGYSTVGVLSGTGVIQANIGVGRTPLGIDVDLNTNLTFVANTQGNTLSVIDGSTNAVTATLAVMGQYVAVNPVTEKVYVTGSSKITVLNEK
jgi:YVTN family beta-propeller protein